MPTLTFAGALDALHGHFGTWWRAQSPVTIGGDAYAMPPIRAENGGWEPGPGDAYVELHVLEASRVTFGGPDAPVRESRGILQVDLLLPGGSGTALFRELNDRVEACWLAMRGTVPGMRTYTTKMARPLADVPEPWAGRHVDTEYLWISG